MVAFSETTEPDWVRDVDQSGFGTAATMPAPFCSSLTGGDFHVWEEEANKWNKEGVEIN